MNNAFITGFFLLSIISSSQANEIKIQGVVDIRATSADTLTSYRDGYYGKFDVSNGESLSLAQAGFAVISSWDNGISAHLVANAYSQKIETAAGITEAFLKYTSLPNENGYRWQSKLGIFYPEFSIENNATAWASPNTLNFSTINTWIGEEIRVLGNEYTITRLGKYHNSNIDFSLTGALFINNDPAGSLLAWHGWTLGNRQTLWSEKVTLPPLPVLRENGALNGKQSENADPFYEIDDNLGFYVKAKMKWHKQLDVALAYYNNQATPYIVEQGQYGWRTRFTHLSAKWRISKSFSVYSQFIHGNTLMQNGNQQDVVNNDYQSGYVAISHKVKKHKTTLRIEEFSVTDNDNFAFDNNTEYGKSFTANYTYRVSRPWFLSVEYNWIKSNRMSRAYVQEPVSLTEKQLQFAARYFF